MISEIYILFFKASLTIRHTATVSQKKRGTSEKIQWDFQISRVGSLDFLDLKVNGSPVNHSRRVVVSYKRKYVHEVLVNCLFKLAQKKSVVR